MQQYQQDLSQTARKRKEEYNIGRMEDADRLKQIRNDFDEEKRMKQE